MRKQTVVVRCSFSTLKNIHQALQIATRAMKFRSELPCDYDEADDAEYQADMQKAVREGEELAFELFYAGSEQLDPSGRLALGF